MTTPPVKSPRPVQPRTWSVLGTAAASGLAAALATSPYQAMAAALSPALPGFQMASEGGESGEGAVQTEDHEVAFLVRLGYFAATHIIVSTLYAGGDVDLAIEHLEQSHHAEYDDIEGDLAAYNATGFEPLAVAFAKAVRVKADPADVAAKAQAVLAAIAAVHASGVVSAKDEMKALALIAATAAEDFEAGASQGRVEVGQEYRDAWGFLNAALTVATALAASSDADTATAGTSAQKVLVEALAQFPALVSDTAGTDPSVIHSAAAWIDFAVVRMK